MKKLFFKWLIIYTMISISAIIWYRTYSIDLSNMSVLETWSSVTWSMDYVPWEVLVKYKMPTKAWNGWIDISNLSLTKSLSKNLSKQNLSIKDTIPEWNIWVISIQDNKTVEETIELLENDKDVEYVEPNYILHLATIDTNDTSGSLLWWLDNYGQEVNWVSWLYWEDIDRYEAYQVFSWSFSDSNTWKIIWIIDAWVNYNHEDLQGSMRDDVWYDFVNQDPNPMPTASSHGTHIAWTIAARINNWKWIIWVNPNSKIMSLKISETTDNFRLSRVIQAIDYATNNWIKIINASFWGYEYSTWLYEAIQRFRNTWWLFIVAAMNDSIDNDNLQWRVFPCSYDLDNIICVAATDQNGLLADFSNYWSQTVDIWAPWVNILSTVINGHREKIYKMTFENINDLNSLYNSGWYFSGWEISTDGRSIIFDTHNNPSNAYLESPVIDTSITNSNDIFIDPWIECTGYNTNISTKYLALEVNTWAWWIRVAGYFSRFIDYWPMNVGPAPQLQYRFYYDWRPEDSYDTWLFCNIYAIDLSYYKDYEWPNNIYWYMNGTSMATPHVVWLASLAWSFRPDLTYIDIKNAILDNWDSLPSLSGKTVSWKRINVYKTLVALDNYSPESPTLLTPSSWYQYTGFDTTLQVPFEWSASHDTWVWVSWYIFELSNNNEFSELITWITLDDTWLNFDIISTWTYYWRVKAFDKKWNTWEYSDIYPFSVEKTSCSFNGTLINNWESVTWYEISTVPYWWTCIFEIRTCTNWILSWSYEYPSCSIEDPLSCTFNWNTINHESSVTGYKTDTVPYWQTCESEIRTCTNWTLSWSFLYWSCTVEDPVSCTFNGITVNHWSSVSWYKASVVSYWQTCESETRACTNWILSWSFIYSSCVVKTSEWGWWFRLIRDKCPNGDFSDSYYDWKCATNNSYKHNSNDDLVYNTQRFNPYYSDEMNKAYQYAYYYGITTQDSISSADMEWSLTRIAMAKMLSQYAIKVLWIEPDKTVQNRFLDVTDQLDLQYDSWVTLAYQLGIMWINMPNNKFRPFDTVTRAEFATALSRLKYHTDDGKDVYYSTHINLLNRLWIITNTDPSMKELRWYAMLMIMRSAEK